MKTIVFFLSSYSTINTGVGGHYRSLKEIASILQSDFDVRIFTFGNVPSPILQQLDCYRHVETGPLVSPGTWRTLRNLRKELSFEPDREVLYVTVGDLICYVPILLCLGLGSGPVAHLKPGGPVFPRSYMFNGLPLMVFHRQDYRLFEAHDSKRPLALAPGRVSPPPYDREYLNHAVPRLIGAQEGQLRLLTICRIAEEKATSLSVMYGALENLEGSPVSTHIGVLQSRSVLHRLEQHRLAFSHEILVDDDVVDTAARAIHACDLFIGLGRSAMEAMALGKIAFVPVRDREGAPRLVAVTRQNWRIFQHHNFTDRTPMDELEATGEPLFIEDVVGDFDHHQHLGQEGQDIFREHLSIETSASAWRQFYDDATGFRVSRLRDLFRVCYFVAMALKRQLKPIKR
ncbi:Glycosyltransferase involved in cell wall bisynthesis [Marinobacter daqiaonensis]|uniref:Glycosyltransferase involved in cell wall bisynthesis n=1 Tax=Marinobacter daqiaonensis TaxID=650891 RepID=A0A1I6I4W1_9GAMM|nr:glycosyltransferase family 1 protein [Marinobacter daqiaonensis]SFR61741.1 Glycosyltransferase involved in cell wall bisynthesis [Marinobacter daqiaonensis]